jgi:endonuclease YncB( thermonuclease family)
MRKSIYLVLLLLCLGFQNAFAEVLIGKVVGVSDGDTITLLDGAKVQYKIRLVGIDAPEKAQPFGQASKRNLSDMIFGKEVHVEWFKKDRYQRTLGKVILDGQDVCLEQVKRGMAWHYKKYQREQSVEDQRLYSEAEVKARTSKLGLWIDPDPIEPSEFRHKK